MARQRRSDDGFRDDGDGVPLLLGRGLRQQPGQHVDEERDEHRIERAAGFLAKQADRAVGAERLVVRPLGRHRVVVVDDCQDARADRNRVARDPLRIAVAVPALVMAEDQRRDAEGERHRRDDFRADLRVDADLLELFLGQRAGLRQDVLGHRELADVVQQRRGLDALDVCGRNGHRLRERGRVELHAADVRLRRLVLRVDRARERFDRREVQVGGLLHVPLLVLDPPHVDLVGAVGEVDRREGERRDPVARVRDQPCGERGAAGADEVARRAPEEVRLPDGKIALARRERDRRRNQAGVEQEVHRRRADQRSRDLRERAGRAVVAEQPQGEAGACTVITSAAMLNSVRWTGCGLCCSNGTG